MCDQKHNFSQEFRTTLLPQNASEKCIAEKYTVPPPYISETALRFSFLRIWMLGQLKVLCHVLTDRFPELCGFQKFI